MYAYEEELGKGFISTAFGCRVGVAGEVLMGTDGSVKNIRCISSLNIRVAHEAKGIAGAVLPYLYEEKKAMQYVVDFSSGLWKNDASSGHHPDGFRWKQAGWWNDSRRCG